GNRRGRSGAPLRNLIQPILVEARAWDEMRRPEDGLRGFGRLLSLGLALKSLFEPDSNPFRSLEASLLEGLLQPLMSEPHRPYRPVGHPSRPSADSVLSYPWLIVKLPVPEGHGQHLLKCKLPTF